MPCIHTDLPFWTLRVAAGGKDVLGGQGLAASCLTICSPMPQLDPVTGTLRASAAIPDTVTVTGGDTQHDCHLLSLKRNQAQPRV